MAARELRVLCALVLLAAAAEASSGARVLQRGPDLPRHPCDRATNLPRLPAGAAVPLAPACTQGAGFMRTTSIEVDYTSEDTFTLYLASDPVTCAWDGTGPLYSPTGGWDAVASSDGGSFFGNVIAFNAPCSSATCCTIVACTSLTNCSVSPVDEVWAPREVDTSGSVARLPALVDDSNFTLATSVRGALFSFT